MRVSSYAVDVLSAALLGFVAGIAAFIAGFSGGDAVAVAVVVLLPPLLVRVLLPWLRGPRWWAHALVGVLVAAAMLVWAASSYSS